MSQSTADTSSPYIPSEPYRPPIISHERINPFDKNKPPVYNAAPSGIYASIATTTPAVAKVTAPEIKETPLVTKPVDVTSTYGFDYSYKPSTYVSNVPEPVVVEVKKTVPQESSFERSEPTRGKFERKLSDADIIFGAKPDLTASQKTDKYSRNRSNSSFTGSTSGDSTNYVYGTRESFRHNSFQKSLSVSSDKDGDFSNDPQVIASRQQFQGISNDAFSDFDSPKSIPSATRSWSNNDDDLDDLK